jgi:hypothetical protein
MPPASTRILKKASADDRRVHSEEARDDNEIRADEGYSLYGRCKSSRKIASNLLCWEVNYYSNDAAEALTSQAPDGLPAVYASSIHRQARRSTVNPPCMPPASIRILKKAGVLTIE